MDRNKITACFAEKLGRLRAAANESQQQLANSIGVTREVVKFWESGDRQIKAVDLANVAAHYNVSVDYLLGLSPVSSTNSDLRFICEYTGLSEKAVDKICDIHNFEKKCVGGDHDVLSLFLENYAERFVFLLDAIKFSVEKSSENIQAILAEQGLPPIDKQEKLWNLRKDIQIGVFDFTEYCREIADLTGADDELANIFSSIDELIMSASESENI